MASVTRDAGARPVLRDRAGGEVDVEIGLAELLLVDAEHARRATGRTSSAASTDSRITSPSWPVTVRRPASRHPQRLDHHEVAARGRPGEPGDGADLGLCLRLLDRVARRAEQLLDLGHVDDPRAFLALRLAAGALAHDGGEIALEVAEPGLARVAARDEAEHLVGELDVLVGDAVLFEQSRKQIAPRDLDLFLDRVSGDADDLHPVAQRRRDVEEVIRRADEQARRQVERQIQVVIDERVVLRWVEHLEHRGRRIA